jgi:hypothetical protein
MFVLFLDKCFKGSPPQTRKKEPAKRVHKKELTKKELAKRVRKNSSFFRSMPFSQKILEPKSSRYFQVIYLQGEESSPLKPKLSKDLN